MLYSNVDQLIEEDPRITYDILEEQTRLCRTTSYNIIHHHSKFRKRASRWVPQSLTSQKKHRRLEFAIAQLTKIEERQLWMDNILTGDECWIYLSPLEKPVSNMALKRRVKKPETVVKRGQFTKKIMFIIFFRSKGPVLVQYLEKGKTIDYKCYI